MFVFLVQHSKYADKPINSNELSQNKSVNVSILFYLNKIECIQSIFLWYQIILEMPANVKGGKNYKKGKKGNDHDIIMIERQDDQQIARVIKVLGNRRMTCYCNDNVTRLCRVSGRMRKSEYVEKGDIVLISLREYDDTGIKSVKCGDILAKYPHELLSKLKKEDGINPKLFGSLELMDGDLKDLGIKCEEQWEFDEVANKVEDKEESSDTSDYEEENVIVNKARIKPGTKVENVIVSGKKYVKPVANDDDIDIDNI
jgi:initiation factor 1A